MRDPHLGRRLASIVVVLSVALTAMSAASRGAVAQTAPRVAALDFAGNIIEIQPGGTVTTLFTPPTSTFWVGGTVIPSSTNRGLATVHLVTGQTTINTQISVWEPGTGLTTLATIGGGMSTLFFGSGADLVVDQDGDYIVTNGDGIFRVGAQSGAVTTLTTASFGRLTQNVPVGGLTATAMGGAVVDVIPGGPVATIAVAQNTAPFADVRSDPVTGDLFLADGGLSVLSRSTQTFTSFATTVPQLSIDIDPADRNLITTGFVQINKVDRQGVLIQTLYSLQSSLSLPVISATVVGSRHLASVTPPMNGSQYQVLASFPGQAGQPYAIAASFGFRPGIPTPQGRIPLVPDALFALSFQAPQVFGSFSGSLNTRGEAVGTIQLPRGSSGVRFFLAAVALANGQVARISEPLGVTIR